MKRITLLTATMLLTAIVAFASQANTGNFVKNDGLSKRYRNAQPVIFTERGVKFFVFPNGEFDYRLLRARYVRRGNVNLALQTPIRNSAQINRYLKRGNISFDRFGRISRVANVAFVYDRFGRIFRIGSVIMNYGKKGLLNQVGALDIKYSRQGRIVYRQGKVHGNFYHRNYVCYM